MYILLTYLLTTDPTSEHLIKLLACAKTQEGIIIHTGWLEQWSDSGTVPEQFSG